MQGMEKSGIQKEGMKHMIRIIIQGIHGQMGKKLCELIALREDCHIVAGVDCREHACTVPVFSSLDTCTADADVLIDFSNPTATESAIEYCAAHKLPCVICTTGLSREIEDKLIALSAHTAVFKSANMSVGINLLIALAKQANAILGTEFDVEIVEKHHHNKLDAPSGTALMIADEIQDAAPVAYHYVYDRHAQRQKRDKLEIGIHAVRGGSIVGEHEVIFAGQDEVITLSHSAASRDVFAVGAINAALFLAGKAPGMYSMKDLIQL